APPQQGRARPRPHRLAPGRPRPDPGLHALLPGRRFHAARALASSTADVSLSDRYDDLVRSPVLDADPADRADLISARARHLLILELVDRHFSGPRDAIADLGPGNGTLLRLARELGFRRLIAVDQAHWDPSRSFLTDLDGVELVQANFNEDD